MPKLTKYQVRTLDFRIDESGRLQNPDIDTLTLEGVREFHVLLVAKIYEEKETFSTSETPRKFTIVDEITHSELRFGSTELGFHREVPEV